MLHPIYMRLLPLLVCLFCNSPNLFSQSKRINDSTKHGYLIKGYVYDSGSTTGLEYATVVAERGNKKYGASTNIHGYFELELPSKFRKRYFYLTITSATYEHLEYEVRKIEEIFGRELIFRLSKHNYSLDPITIICCGD